MIRFSNMFRLVIMLMMRFDKILKHVQTCHNAYDKIWYDSRTCLDLYWSSTTSDANWYNSTNLSRLVNMSRHVLNHKMTKYSNIWANGGKKVDDKAIPWTASTSERSKSTQQRNSSRIQTEFFKNSKGILIMKAYGLAYL